MVVVTEPQLSPSETRLSPAAPDEAAARASIRAQIARLEQKLGVLAYELGSQPRGFPLPRAGAPEPSPERSPRLLTFGELESVRDGLVAEVDAAERQLKRCAVDEAGSRDRLQSMLASPRIHRFERVRSSEIGECGCGVYEVRPRAGLLGMLFGWWCVKLSSGCPLYMPRHYYYRRTRERRSRNPKLELTATILVVVVVIAVVVTFLVIYHDFPLRVSGP